MSMMKAMQNIGTNNIVLQTMFIYGLAGGVALFAYRHDSYWAGVGIALGLAVAIGLDDPFSVRDHLRARRQEAKKEATK